MHRTRQHLLRQQLFFVNDPDDTSGGGDGGDGQQPPKNDEGGNSDDKGGFKPISSQDELDRIVQKRLDREKAKYADYDDLKTQATAFETERSELQQKLAAAEERAVKAERGALVARVASDKNVPAKYLEGETEEELLASADEFLAVLEARGPKKGYVPGAGTGSETPPESTVEAGRERARAKLNKNGKD